jgi:hypothetical protein
LSPLEKPAPIPPSGTASHHNGDSPEKVAMIPMTTPMTAPPMARCMLNRDCSDIRRFIL